MALGALLLAAGLPLPAAAQELAPGDANCDGFIAAADVGALARILFGEGDCAGADANEDSVLSAADVVAIVQLIGEVGEEPTASPTAAFSATPSATETSPGITPTASPGLTASIAPTGAATSTRTPTIVGPSPTRTRSPTRTATATRTRTPTRTGTVTRTPTRTRTPTAVLPVGPLITHLGTARADGTPEGPLPTGSGEIPVYCRLVGSGFQIIVEARRGSSGAGIGQTVFASDPEDPSLRPDLQIQVNRDLGSNPTMAVCDRGPPPDPVGGVPGIPELSFAETQEISDALNDLSCRFVAHPLSSEACTLDELGRNAFVNADSQLQFCSAPAVGVELAFPPGDTLLTVRLRDTSGNIGNQAQIIVRAPCSQ